MGKNHSTAANWSVDDWAFGTGENALSIGEVFKETKKIPEKYFGGRAVQNDPSIHRMQQDLFSFDGTVKNLFRRKKHTQANNELPTDEEEYYYYEEEEEDQSGAFAQPTDSEQEPTYLEPVFNNGVLPPTTKSSRNAPRYSSQHFWRCSNCSVENRISEHACQQCGQAETQL